MIKMPQFNNLKELENYLKDKVQNAMRNEVAKTVIDTEKKHVQTDVYAVYTPTEYERTYQLLSDESYVVKDIPDGISVKNIRHDEETGKMIAPVLESGIGYDWDSPINGVPRRFTENTVQDLSQSKDHIKALQNGLKRQGIDTE